LLPFRNLTRLNERERLDGDRLLQLPERRRGWTLQTAWSFCLFSVAKLKMQTDTLTRLRLRFRLGASCPDVKPSRPQRANLSHQKCRQMGYHGMV